MHQTDISPMKIAAAPCSLRMCAKRNDCTAPDSSVAGDSRAVAPAAADQHAASVALPGIVAGSIFTFSLTLGDYITPTLVGGASSTFIGNVVYNTGLGAAGNLPFAAAFASVPLVVMAIMGLLPPRARTRLPHRCRKRRPGHRCPRRDPRPTIRPPARSKS
mgnify:CR=1 FL=1